MPAESPAPVLKRLFTFQEAREATTFSRQWWYKMEAQSHVRLIRLGSKTLVPLEAIDAILSGSLSIADRHRAAHWHGEKQKPEPRRRGRPPKPRPVEAASAG
jgi:hypothetical protein